jgi:Zn finger protein HypA/HybF involved in hydrogenase expression
MESTKEELIKLLIDENKSYEEVGRHFGISGVGIKKRAIKFGLDLSARRIINEKETFCKGVTRVPKYLCLNCCAEFKKYSSHFGKYCSHSCQHEHTHKEYITKWKNGDDNGLQKNGFTLSKHIRNYLFEKNESKCEKCCWCEINEHTQKSPLQIHHIDGDCKNTKEENLQLLCPNCHSLTNNFGSRNKNATNGRSEYFGRNKFK